jgi:hypothetical protein
MDINHTTESQYEDEQLDDALALDTSNSSKRRADFRQHLADFEATAETNPEPIGPALTYIVSDTLEITATLADAIKQALPATPTLDDVERVKGLLNDFFRANRQVDRYANLQLRLEEARAREAEARQAKRADGLMPAVRRTAGRNVH